MKNQRWLLLGCSRGLGKSFSQLLLDTYPELFTKNVFLASRKTDLFIKNFTANAKEMQEQHFLKMDFAKTPQWTTYFKQIKKINPDRIVYFAGGGPFSDFNERKWKDHFWSLKVNFLFPMALITESKNISNLKQMTFIGSAVAESNPDPKAASYSAGKHALKGMVTSLQAEGSLKFDLRLFSPGYMDTDLLPPQSWPRLAQDKNLVKKPEFVAQNLFDWLENPNDANRHLVFDLK